MAEPAEPSASPVFNPHREGIWIDDPEEAVAGEGPQRPYKTGLNERLKREDYAISYLSAAHRDGLFLVALKDIAEIHLRPEVTPKLEEIARPDRPIGVEHYAIYESGDWLLPLKDFLDKYDEDWLKILRPFITPACAPPEQPMTEEELADLQVIDERDHWEDVISDLAVLAGCKEEWSNLHEHGDCIAEEIHRLRATPASTREAEHQHIWLPSPKGKGYSCGVCSKEKI